MTAPWSTASGSRRAAPAERSGLRAIRGLLRSRFRERSAQHAEPSPSFGRPGLRRARCTPEPTPDRTVPARQTLARPGLSGKLVGVSRAPSPIVLARALRLLSAALCCLAAPLPGAAAPLQSADLEHETAADTPLRTAALENALLENVSFSAVAALPSAAPDALRRYGEAPQQFIERWQPAGAGPHPAVVLLHGGCWLDAYGVDHVRPMAMALRDAGFLVIAPEYRRVGDPGGGWPGTFEDVAQVFDALAQDDDQGLDRTRVALVGHSAGGHLALWLAARGGLPTPHPLHAADAGVIRPALVVGLAAITDLERYARGDSGCERAAVQLMDGSPEAVPERYAVASPLRLPRPDVPVVLLQGSEDSIVPGEQARLYLGLADPAAPLASSSDAASAKPSSPGPSGRSARRELLDDRIAAMELDLAAHPDPDRQAAHRTAPAGHLQVETIAGAGHFDPIHPGTPAFRRLLELLQMMAAGVSVETPRPQPAGSDSSP